MNAQSKPIPTLSEKDLERRKRHAEFLKSVLERSDEALSSEPMGEGWWPLPDMKKS